MAKYIIQYYSKTSTISKDKELVSLLEKLNSADEDNEELLKEILAETLANVIQKESGLYKHSKSRLLEKIISKKDDNNKKIIEFIKELENKFLNEEITRSEFVDKVFKKAKKDRTFISRTHFLMYVKKLQEEKLIMSIKDNPNVFIRKIKENRPGKEISNFINDWLFNGLKGQRIIANITYKAGNTKTNMFDSLFETISSETIFKGFATAKFASKHILKKSFLKKNKKGDYVNLKQFLFKVISSEPITNKDIEKWTNLDKSIESLENYGIKIDKDKINEFKKKFFIIFRKKVLLPLENSLIEELSSHMNQAKLMEKDTSIMPYYKKLKEISYNFKGLDKESIENVIYSSFNEKHETQFFNFNLESVKEILKYIEETKQLLKENDSDEEIKEALEDFEKILIEIKDKKEITKDEALSIKEVYETFKEKVFLYNKSKQEFIEPLFQSFSNIRNAYKKTFFKSTKQMLDIYRQNGIDKIKIEVSYPGISDNSSPYLKFNPYSRMFEFYNKEGEEPRFSLPVSAVMNKERTAVKKNIYLGSILSKEKKISDNIKNIGFISVKNYEEINKTLQKNFYNFKQEHYANQIKKDKKNNPEI